MRIIELFAGIGACSLALKRIGIDLEIMDAVENNKYAIASFNRIHGTNFSVQDIREWNKDFYNIDIITHGSPCQDFSVAGKQAGGDLGSGTRSSLMYETIRIVDKIKPKYVLWENVKNILSKKHIHNFNNYIETIDKLGYNSYYQVLNAKDYGIPQNRERVYTISIRKDIDNNSFRFPEKEALKLKLKDILEKNVDEKYYLSSKMINYITADNDLEENCDLKEILCNYLIKNKMVEENDIIRHSYSSNRMRNFRKQNAKNNNIAPTLDTRCDCLGIAIRNGNKKGYDVAIEGDSINFSYPNSKIKRGRVGHQISQTLQCSGSMGVFNELRIRKLTPKECWRLMGFRDEDFEKAQNIPTSNAQLYKQAGNSIVVNVLEKIFTALFFEGGKKDDRESKSNASR